MFARDRDLLIPEPDLLRTCAWSGQKLFETADASIDASGLILSAPEANFETLGIGAGHVALIDSTPYEVIERADPQTLAISRLRASPDGPPIPALPGSSLATSIRTFAHQIGWVHETIMRSAGLGPEDEALVTNTRELARLEALGALHLIFAAASLGTPTSALAGKAELYRRRFGAERSRTSVRIDLDSDGESDALRPLGSFRLERA